MCDLINVYAFIHPWTFELFSIFLAVVNNAGWISVYKHLFESLLWFFWIHSEVGLPDHVVILC